jgi:hypothetical protein
MKMKLVCLALLALNCQALPTAKTDGAKTFKASTHATTADESTKSTKVIESDEGVAGNHGTTTEESAKPTDLIESDDEEVGVGSDSQSADLTALLQHLEEDAPKEEDLWTVDEIGVGDGEADSSGSYSSSFAGLLGNTESVRGSVGDLNDMASYEIPEIVSAAPTTEPTELPIDTEDYAYDTIAAVDLATEVSILEPTFGAGAGSNFAFLAPSGEGYLTAPSTFVNDGYSVHENETWAEQQRVKYSGSNDAPLPEAAYGGTASDAYSWYERTRRDERCGRRVRGGDCCGREREGAE